MKTDNINDSLEWKTKRMSVVFNEQTQQMNIYTGDDELLISVPSLSLVAPLFSGREPAMTEFITGTHHEKRFNVVFHMKDCPISKYEICFELFKDSLIFQSNYIADTDHTLYGWELFPANTWFNLYELINFRHLGGLRDIYINIPLRTFIRPSGIQWEKTGTYSDDWNFSPHPSFLIFRKNTIHLSIGALDLPAGFGLQCSIKNELVSRFIHDYGEGVYKVKTKEKIQSPRYVLNVKRFPGTAEMLNDEWLMEMGKEFVSTIQEQGLIPAASAHRKFQWHKQTHYCTWGDQCFLAAKKQSSADEAMTSQQQQQDFAAANKIVAPQSALNEEMVKNMVEVIKREKLPFKIFIIDDGWQKGLGEWVVDDAKFPDFRGLIDWLHKEGFKVALWWAPIHLDLNRKHWPGAQYLADNGHTLMTHGIPLIDFSNPLTQKEYLNPLLRRMISPEQGCYNADMIKLDFMADKVQRHIPVYNRNWCGEEKYFHELFRHVATICREYKQDFCFFTQCPHPYLAQWQELVLTGELWTSDIWAHWEKMRYIKTFSPGVEINYFSHMYRENSAEFYDMAYKEKCSVSQYGVLGYMDSKSGTMTQEDYKLLRKKLKKWNR